MLLRAAALLAGALLAAPGAAAAEQPREKALEIPARAYVLIDAEEGDLLAGRGENRRSSIASATKLMTAFVARRSLELDEALVAPPYQALAAESLLGLQPGERIEVRDLLYGLLLASGNDAAVTLAQGSAGSVEAFVRRMNVAAVRLGLDRTSYANPIGLDEPGNHSTAGDLAALAVRLREDRVFHRIFDTTEYVTRSGAQPRRLVNRNTLVHAVPWIDGVKTGYTLEAGYVLVASGERRGAELVAVVLGAPSEEARDAGALELLRYGISLYERERVLTRGTPVSSALLVDQAERLELVPAATVEVTARRDEEVATRLDAPAEVEGPIERGQRLGTAIVSVDGDVEDRVGLLAARAASAASPLERFDGAVPGPRAFAWACVLAVPVVLLVLIVGLARRRRASSGFD